MNLLEFPSLQNLSLSQEIEDQESLKRIKAVWDKYAPGWDTQTNLAIINNLGYIQANTTNRNTPSRHRIYRTEFNFGTWVLLRCIYPGHKLQALKAILLEKYPGIDPNSFEGPDSGKMTQKKTKAETTMPSFSKEKLLEEDDIFDCSDFHIKQEDITLVAELPEAPKIQPSPSANKMRPDKRNADTNSQGRQSASKAELLHDKSGSGSGHLRTSRPSASRLSLKSLEPQLRAIESTFRTLIHEGPSRGHYDEFVKKKAKKRHTLADILNKDKGAERKGVWVERGSDVGPLTNSESDHEGAPSKPAFSDQQYQELKNIISHTAAETKGTLSGEMLDMQTMIMKKLQSMNLEMMKQFKDSQKQMLDVGRQVTGLRGAIESVRRGEKDIQELEAKVVNLEEFITSL